MNNLKPSQLIGIGSFAVVAFTFLLLIVLNFLLFPIPFYVFLGLPLLIAGFTAVVYYFLIKDFIHTRLQLLYRSIRKGKITKENEFRFKFNEDAINDAAVETKKWSDEKQSEISQLKEQEEFRREFLGNLAHELKTPVFSIQGYLLTLLEGGLEDESVNSTFLERASKATDRMVSLLEDLDEITKLEGNHLKLEKKPFVINDLVSEIFEYLELSAKEKDITLQFAKNYEPIKVFADRSKMAQVFTNLIGNSITYNNEGGTTRVRLYNVEDFVTIEVSDNGPGIEESSLPRIFERFYRVEKSRDRKVGGSGLGLSIVKHIIESHGQSITVRSTVGIGTTFVFTLDKANRQV